MNTGPSQMPTAGAISFTLTAEQSNVVQFINLEDSCTLTGLKVLCPFPKLAPNAQNTLRLNVKYKFEALAKEVVPCFSITL